MKGGDNVWLYIILWNMIYDHTFNSKLSGGIMKILGKACLIVLILAIGIFTIPIGGHLWAIAGIVLIIKTSIIEIHPIKNF